MIKQYSKIFNCHNTCSKTNKQGDDEITGLLQFSYLNPLAELIRKRMLHSTHRPVVFKFV